MEFTGLTFKSPIKQNIPFHISSSPFPKVLIYPRTRANDCIEDWSCHFELMSQPSTQNFSTFQGIFWRILKQRIWSEFSSHVTLVDERSKKSTTSNQTTSSSSSSPLIPEEDKFYVFILIFHPRTRSVAVVAYFLSFSFYFLFIQLPRSRVSIMYVVCALPSTPSSSRHHHLHNTVYTPVRSRSRGSIALHYLPACACGNSKATTWQTGTDSDS